MKTKIKLDSEHLFELATLEMSLIWRMKYFFCYCLNTAVCEFNTLNIGTVNAIQTNLSGCTKRASKPKVHFHQRYCSKFIPNSVFICLLSNFLFQHGKKALKTNIIILHMFLLLQEIS